MDFKLNKGKLDSAINQYNNSINLLSKNLTALQSSLNNLKETGWEGKAKDKFITVEYADWETGMKEHISRLEFLNGILKEARSELGGMVDKSNKIDV